MLFIKTSRIGGNINFAECDASRYIEASRAISDIGDVTKVSVCDSLSLARCSCSHCYSQCNSIQEPNCHSIKKAIHLLHSHLLRQQ
jgi:hypothetical protein